MMEGSEDLLEMLQDMVLAMEEPFSMTPLPSPPPPPPDFILSGSERFGKHWIIFE